MKEVSNSEMEQKRILKASHRLDKVEMECHESVISTSQPDNEKGDLDDASTVMARVERLMLTYKKSIEDVVVNAPNQKQEKCYSQSF